MEISFVRIDDRLIHGQVATVWTKDSGCNRIMAVSDEVAADDLRKQLVIQVSPPGIKAYVVTIEKAIEAYKNPKFDSFKTLFLFTNPKDVVRMVEGGVDIKSVNVGGMCYKEGTKQITNALCVSETDIDAFKKLNEYGIELEIRKLAKDNKISMMDKLKELKLI
jgi:PTS system mannose-specific IIB component